jgi:hypothetical protein
MTTTYLGNYSHLIKSEWIDFFLAPGSGQLFPDDRECLRPDFNDQNQAIHAAWDFKSCGGWYNFDMTIIPFSIPWPVALTNNYDWWVVKQYPGQCVPYHYDPCDPASTRRFIMPLDDYKPGHMLLWGNELIKGYAIGDLIELNDTLAYHGSANVSNDVRLMAYLSVFDIGVEP